MNIAISFDSPIHANLNLFFVVTTFFIKKFLPVPVEDGAEVGAAEAYDGWVVCWA